MTKYSTITHSLPLLSLSDSALQVEAHSSSSDGSTTTGSRTPTPLYHEPADTLGNTSDPVRVTSKGTLPRNDTLRSKYMYRSPMERAEDDLNKMVETSQTANRGRIIMPLELEMRTRSNTDTLPALPTAGRDSPDYQWSPPAGHPLPYTLQNGSSNHIQYRDEDNRTRHGSSSSHADRHNNNTALRNQHRDHHDSIHRDQNHHDFAFHQTGRDVTRHHSDVARHHHDVQRRNNDIVRHHSDIKPRHSDEPISSIVSDMPRPNSPPHDHLSSQIKTDYPKSSPTRAPPFKPPPPARRSDRSGSPTASVTSFEYQCLSPFKMNKKSRSQKHRHRDQHTQSSSHHTNDRQALPHSHPHTTAVYPRDPNSVTMSSDSGVGAPRKLTYTAPSRQYTLPSRHRQNLPDITQTANVEEEFDHLSDEQPRAHANIHRRPTKLAEEEEKRITMEKTQQRQQVRYAASAARYPSQYDDGDATLV